MKQVYYLYLASKGRCGLKEMRVKKFAVENTE